MNGTPSKELNELSLLMVERLFTVLDTVSADLPTTAGTWNQNDSNENKWVQLVANLNAGGFIKSTVRKQEFFKRYVSDGEFSFKVEGIVKDPTWDAKTITIRFGDILPTKFLLVFTIYNSSYPDRVMAEADIKVED